MADGVLSGPHRDSRQPDTKREDRDLQDAESRGPRVMQAPSAKHGFHPVIQNATMTFSSFVDTKFIPEHVQHKTACRAHALSGHAQAPYQA